MAEQVGQLLNFDVGEHSNLNCPVHRAREEISVMLKRKELKKPYKDTASNPWCAECMEEFCMVSFDGTCAQIREYQKTKYEQSKKENDR